jgi:hypothetical protein
MQRDVGFVLVRAEGAAFDQGVAQGLARRREIGAHLRKLRRRFGLLGWLEGVRHANHGPFRALRDHLPQHHERLRGIALGAGTWVGSLAIAGVATRVGGVGSARGGELEARLEIPAELEPLLLLRRSRPDAVGFASVELSCAHWPGSLAGVNERGLAVVVLEDRDAAEPTLRTLAQELLLRGETVDSAAEHLRRRARYAGGTGTLLVADADCRAARLVLREGSVSDAGLLPEQIETPAEFTVRLDGPKRTLSWTASDGNEYTVQP